MSRGSYDNIKNINEDEDEPPALWTSEVVHRAGGLVVIMYLGDYAKGQVHVDSQEEADQWTELVQRLNTPKS